MALRSLTPIVNTVQEPSLNADHEIYHDERELKLAARTIGEKDNTSAPGIAHHSTILEDDTFYLAQETYKLLYISLPSVIVQFSVRCIFPQTASIVGRLLGTRELAAFSLGSLTANLLCQSIIMGALTAAETYMPRAFGEGNYRQVGQLAIQGTVVCGVLLLVPVLLLGMSMERIFIKLGQDEEASKLASAWIQIYLLAIPFVLIFRVLQAFLNAQHVVLPLVFGSVIASFVVHPLLLRLVVPKLGLWGSGLCIVLTQGSMVLFILVYLYIRTEHYPETWPGISGQFVRDSLQPGPLWSFVKLSLGGVLSLSEWWFWETVCFVIGSFGVLPLAVHSIAYNIIPVVFMGAVGLATGLTVRIGNEVSGNVARAKRIAKWCMGLAVVSGLIISLLLYHFRVTVVRLFTDDEQVVQGCMEIWSRVCIFVFLLYIFCINRGILRALGMQWQIAAVVVVCLWCGALPLVFYKAVYLQNGLDAIWTILPCVYAIMQVFLVFSYTRFDWRRVDDGDRNEEDEAIASNKDVEMEALTFDS